MGRFDGAVAVVTGGASGIGEATARLLVAEGARLVVADVQEERGAEVVSELGADAHFVACDVTDEAAIAAAIDTAVGAWGRLDVMFNNAGIVGAMGPIAETSADDWDGTVAVLLRSVFLGMKHAARHMVPQGSGSIVSTSSTAGIAGGLGPHAYTAAKHGVIGLTKSVANELAPHGVRVNAVSPGSTVTPLIAAVTEGDPGALDPASERLSRGNLLGVATEADEIAGAVAYLSSADARSITGHTLVVDAGFTTSGFIPNRFHQGTPSVLREGGRRDRGS